MNERSIDRRSLDKEGGMCSEISLSVSVPFVLPLTARVAQWNE